MRAGTARRTLTPLGREINKALVDAGMTQRELAEQLGVKQPALSRAMHGRRSGEAYWPQIQAILGLKPQTSKGGRHA